MPVNEKDFTHVRLTPENGKKLRGIVKETRRSINVEANIAVEQYRTTRRKKAK